MHSIYLALKLFNPFCEDTFKNLKDFYWRITQFYSVEIELLYYKPMIVEASVGVTINGDHDGIYIEIGLLRYSLSISIYDSRHKEHKNA
mgnify:CR=1 FL=1